MIKCEKPSVDFQQNFKLFMIKFDFEYDFKLRLTINSDFRYDFIFYSKNNFYSVSVSVSVSVIDVKIDICFFLKSIFRFIIHITLFLSEFKIWIDFVEIIFDSLIQIEKHIFLILKLLHHYQHLNDKDFRNLFCINLIIHRVRLIFETIFSNKFQLRWLTHTKW